MRVARAGLVAGLAASVLVPIYALVVGGSTPREGLAGGGRPQVRTTGLARAARLRQEALGRQIGGWPDEIPVEIEEILATRATKTGLWPNAMEGRRLEASLKGELERAYGSPEKLERAMARLGVDGGDLRRLANQRAAVKALVEREVPAGAASPERVHAAYLYGGPWRSPDEVHVALGRSRPDGHTTWEDIGWLPATELPRLKALGTRALSSMGSSGILPIRPGHATVRILGRRPGHPMTEAEATVQIRRALLTLARSHAIIRLLADDGHREATAGGFREHRGSQAP